VDEAPRPGPPAAAPTAGGKRFACRGCGADLSWDPARRGLSCPFCREGADVAAGGPAAERDLAEALSRKRAAPAAPGDAGAGGARILECSACGARVEIPPTLRAGRCAYCGSSRIVEEEADPDRLRPDSVIPFAVSGPQAEELFRKWIRGLWFRPSALKRQSALHELRGVMVPYWTFDAGAASSWTAMAGHYYYVPVPTKNGVRMERRVRWVPASGSRADVYDDLLVLASKGLDPELTAKIEPFKVDALEPYRDEYLAGLSAENYAVPVGDGWGKACLRIHAEQEARCARDVPGDTHMALSVKTKVDGRRFRLALLPVWIAAYNFRGKVYRFLVNGQTGEVQGRAPLSWWKIAGAVLGGLVVVGIVILVVANS
jgi:DNA-directed RNA polymerase subunit RPC12/RpoP